LWPASLTSDRHNYVLSEELAQNNPKKKKNCVEMWCKKFDKPTRYKNPTKTLKLLNPKTKSMACGKQ
jgi:hypothetical protein